MAVRSPPVGWRRRRARSTMTPSSAGNSLSANPTTDAGHPHSAPALLRMAAWPQCAAGLAEAAMQSDLEYRIAIVRVRGRSSRYGRSHGLRGQMQHLALTASSSRGDGWVRCCLLPVWDGRPSREDDSTTSNGIRWRQLMRHGVPSETTGTDMMQPLRNGDDGLEGVKSGCMRRTTSWSESSEG